ncbi:MAG: HAD family hydrolase [Kiritimatiellaeota bacterium]|nr:HAD family hydrolase [Kiritimatiellota bacterium]
MPSLHIPRRHDTLVGIDSDGCVFDSMRVKQCLHFHPLIIRFWGLERVEPQLRACAEFVNLTSKTRGSNRFAALIRTFGLLRAHPGAQGANLTYPDLSALKAYLASGVPLGNPTLRQALAQTPDAELQRVYDWSLAVDNEIAANMKPVPPFAAALKALAQIQADSDAVVISQTPEAALTHEWDTHGIRSFVGAIAGLEFGTKAQQICAAAAGRYPPERILMIGDAVGDQQAADANGACFYPIMPGAEETSWERFCDEAYPRFLCGDYTGDYAQSLAAAFHAALPDEMRFDEYAP